VVLDCVLCFFQEIIADDVTHDFYLNVVFLVAKEVINEAIGDFLHYFLLYFTSHLTFIHITFIHANFNFIIVFIFIVNYVKFI
jgi:hypothetical protein